MLMTTGVTSIDVLEQELLRIESTVSQLRARQLDVIAELDRAQVCAVDGARTLAEWVTGRLDVAPETGKALAYAAVSESRILESELAAGEVTLDRVVAARRLANAGADDETLAGSAGVAVNHVRRLVARRLEMSSGEEAAVYQTRALYAQPNLANTAWNLHGRLAALDGEMVFAALEDAADQLVPADDPHRPTLVQRRADTLVAWAMNHLDPRGATHAGPAVSKRLSATIHLDTTLVADTAGRAGGTTRRGVKTGPNALDEVLCVGHLDTVAVDKATVKTVDVNLGPKIPKPVRDHVWHRDGGCTADGCVSTYRLEIHHIQPRSRGGNHHPDNLTVLCWYHHHIVIHNQGFTIDPDTPPGRRRFRPPRHRYPPGTDPPHR